MCGFFWRGASDCVMVGEKNTQKRKVIYVERKRPTEALFWVVIMIFLPYFGTILYLVFGSTVAIKLTAIIRKKKLKAQPYNVELLPSASAHESQLSESDLQVVRFNTVYNASVLTCYNKAELYTIHHDMVGEKLAELLAQKAKEGVEVWVMCDFIANLSTPKKMFQPPCRCRWKGCACETVFYTLPES